MADTTRLHGNASMDPTEYEYVGWLDLGENLVNYSTEGLDDRKRLGSLVGRSGYAIDQCTHCGARLRYVTVMLHTPTGEHIAIGNTCAEERFGADSPAAEIGRAHV